MAQSTLPGYLEGQKKAKKRYSQKNLQKRLSKHNDVNAVIESIAPPKGCFSHSDNLTTTTCIAHCVASHFGRGKNKAPAKTCYYLELHELRKFRFNTFPRGSFALTSINNINVLVTIWKQKSNFLKINLQNDWIEPPSLKPHLLQKTLKN